MRHIISIPKAEGTVKWFDDAKGYGFIVYNDIEYFVHFKNIKMKGHKTLTKDQRVSFIPATSKDNKPIALKVELL